VAKTPHLRIAVLAGAVLLAVPASAPAARSRPPAIYAVTLKDMKFGPTPPAMHVGDTVEWTNDDIFVHSATAKDGSFDVELKPKARLWTTFHAPGKYVFTCRYHPGMSGTLEIRP